MDVAVAPVASDGAHGVGRGIAAGVTAEGDHVNDAVHEPSVVGVHELRGGDDIDTTGLVIAVAIRPIQRQLAVGR